MNFGNWNFFDTVYTVYTYKFVQSLPDPIVGIDQQSVILHFCFFSSNSKSWSKITVGEKIPVSEN